MTEVNFPASELSRAENMDTGKMAFWTKSKIVTCKYPVNPTLLIMLGVKVHVQCVTCLCLIIISYVWWMWCNLLSLLTSSINCVNLKDAHKLLKAKNRPQNAVFFTHHSNLRSDTIICRSNCQEVDSVNYFCFVHCVAAKLIQFSTNESTSPPFNYALIETTEFFFIIFFT